MPYREVSISGRDGNFSIRSPFRRPIRTKFPRWLKIFKKALLVLLAAGTTTAAAAAAVSIAATTTSPGYNVAAVDLIQTIESSALNASTAGRAGKRQRLRGDGNRHEQHLGLGFAHGMVSGGALAETHVDACVGNGRAGNGIVEAQSKHGNGLGLRDCGEPSPSD